MKIVVSLLSCLILSLPVAHSAPKKGVLAVELDALINVEKVDTLNPDSLVKMLGMDPTKPELFDWLNKEKTRAIFKGTKFSNKKIHLTLEEGGIPIDEAVVDFKDGKFEGVTISVFNRGDSGKISASEFDRRKKVLTEKITQILDKKPRVRTGNLKRGIMTSGLVWESKKGKAVLVHNIEAPKMTEFLRLRFAMNTAEGIYEAALEDRSYATVRKSRLVRNVVKKEGNVYIDNIPMVDQGNKGYCVVASAQRLFEYYGIACDMHQLAQLAKSDPDEGTSSIRINKELGSIDHLFQTRFQCLAIKHKDEFAKIKDEKYIGKKVSRSSFYKMVYSNIDDGIPLLWSLDLGIKPEEPNLNPQTEGGHMRMIIGYNKEKNRIIFSDSWGEGHEYKTMDADDFYVVTKGLFVMTPTGY